MISCFPVSNKSISYFFISFLIVFTSFEYFFRAGILTSVFYIFTISITLLKKVKLHFSHLTIFLLLILVLFPCLHFFKGMEFNIKLLFSSLLTIAGIYSISQFSAKHFIKCYLHIIYIISIVSLFFWLICLIPEIKEFLFYNVASNFPSLNKEIANTDNAGINIVIYNFQSLWIDELIGISRNCGPFWEPGMYAVYLVSSLYLYNFWYTADIKLFNPIIIISLATTLSTGGIIAGLFVGVVYYFSYKISSIQRLYLLPGLIILIIFVLSLEYIGAKTIEQLENSQIGSDNSRFGAMYTQISMILNSPLIGGENITSYTSGKTLASGLLLPLVHYGIVGGCAFYILMCISYLRIFKIVKHKKYGLTFFILMLILSISQTILTMPFFVCLIFVGLVCPLNITQNENTYNICKRFF